MWGQRESLSSLSNTPYSFSCPRLLWFPLWFLLLCLPQDCCPGPACLVGKDVLTLQRNTHTVSLLHRVRDDSHMNCYVDAPSTVPAPAAVSITSQETDVMMQDWSFQSHICSSWLFGLCLHRESWRLTWCENDWIGSNAGLRGSRCERFPAVDHVGPDTRRINPRMLCLYIISILKEKQTALAGVAQWIERQSVNQRVTGLTPS